jgi:formate dehydrogenase iron-sulfur subunit
VSTELGLAVRRRSATPASSTNIRTDTPQVSKIVDIDLCIGCKACEVACKEWNDLPVDDTSNFGSYQSHEDLTATTWDLMRFNEVELANNDIAWLIRKDSCLHCEDPGCLAACPAPGAIVQYENGIVDFDQTKCIGCQYCVTGCPFDIPRFDPASKKVYKCTLCVDRVTSGLEPACVKACPTGSIKYGSTEDMVAYGTSKVAKLQARGFENAMLYNPAGVGGVHMMYVVPRGDMLAEYGLPSDPNVKKNVSFIGLLRNTRRLGAAATWAGILGLAVFWLRYGRHAPPPEEAGTEDAVYAGEHGGNGHVVEGLGGNAPAPAGGNGQPVEERPVEGQPTVTSEGKERS